MKSGWYCLAMVALALGLATWWNATHPSKRQMMEDIAQLTQLYRDNWSYVAEKQKQTGYSLDDLQRLALAEAAQTWTWDGFDEVVGHFISRLQDGHSWMVPPTHGNSLPTYYLLPFKLRETRDGIVVQKVIDDRSGLMVGDLVLSGQGRPIAEVLKHGLQLTYVSCDLARLHQLVETMDLSRKPHLAMTVERDSREFPLTVEGSLITDPNFRNAELAPWIGSQKLRPNIGLVRIKTFYPDAMERQTLDKRNAPDSDWAALNKKADDELAATMATVQDCATIIIDLRDNGGGTDAVGHEVAAYFLPPGTLYYSIEWRNCPYIREHRADLDFRHLPTDVKGDWFPIGQDRLSEKAAHPLYDKRVILITDEGCFSATSDFISAMQANDKHLRIVGRPEDAGGGGPRHLGTLKNSGIEVWGSTCRVFRPDGSLLEGHPVMPDVPVQWTRDDIIQGRDPDIAAALELAAKSDW